MFFNLLPVQFSPAMCVAMSVAFLLFGISHVVGGTADANRERIFMYNFMAMKRLLIITLVCLALPCLSANVLVPRWDANGGPCILDFTNLDLLPQTGGTLSSLTTTSQTNWVSGQFYTNRIGHEIEVSCSVTNIMAAVVGFAGMELWTGYSTNSSTVVGTGATTTKTLVTGLATTQEMHLRGRVPVGGYFVFTNISSGTGNSVAIRNNSSQYTVLP